MTQRLEQLHAILNQARAEVRRVIIGQDEVLDQALVVVLTNQHGLIEGVPGVAKTLLAKTLSRVLGCDFARIQFTPDLMPSDITGTNVFDLERRDFKLIEGPIFTSFLLADEINRAPAKTQSALLEAMQEYQVTVGGVRYALERPLFVLATENPIEQEGTHPLPEAQLDRFMLNVVIDYPDLDDERQILAATTSGVDNSVSRVATGAELEAARHLVRQLPAASNVVDYALRLVRATRPNDASCPPSVKEWVRWGVGPRAGQDQRSDGT